MKNELFYIFRVLLEETIMLKLLHELDIQRTETEIHYLNVKNYPNFPFYKLSLLQTFPFEDTSQRFLTCRRKQIGVIRLKWPLRVIGWFRIPSTCLPLKESIDSRTNWRSPIGSAGTSIRETPPQARITKATRWFNGIASPLGSVLGNSKPLFWRRRPADLCVRS